MSHIVVSYSRPLDKATIQPINEEFFKEWVIKIAVKLHENLPKQQISSLMLTLFLQNGFSWYESHAPYT